MKYKIFYIIILFFLHQLALFAQEEDFDMGAFKESSEAKNYCNNKVLGLSPNKLISISFDYIGNNIWNTAAGDDFKGLYDPQKTHLQNNTGLRLETNYPLISKNSIVLNTYLNYLESNYSFGDNQTDLSNIFATHPLRSTVFGAVIFKPINEKKFFIFQADASLNGNYDFVDISPDFNKIKVSGSVLFGWKRNEHTNLAFGLSRTYRGGSALIIPVILWNKTFNSTWGAEVLFPARAAVRRNFSTKSLMILGYELEGQSYHIQNNNGTASPFFSSGSSSNNWELRKSEIRARLSWDKAITDFIWFNIQAGAVINYRFDIVQEANKSDAWLTNSMNTPFYLRFGIQLVSP